MHQRSYATALAMVLLAIASACRPDGKGWTRNEGLIPDSDPLTPLPNHFVTTALVDSWPNRLTQIPQGAAEVTVIRMLCPRLWGMVDSHGDVDAQGNVAVIYDLMEISEDRQWERQRYKLKITWHQKDNSSELTFVSGELIQNGQPRGSR